MWSQSRESKARANLDETLYHIKTNLSTKKKEVIAMRKIRIEYYLPNQSQLFSEPFAVETDNGKEYERIVNIIHEKNYKVVSVKHVEEKRN